MFLKEQKSNFTFDNIHRRQFLKNGVLLSLIDFSMYVETHVCNRIERKIYENIF